jgi:hypothetical protein
MAEYVSGGVPIASFIKNSPFPGRTGASISELEDATKAIAWSLCNLFLPRLTPCRIRSSFVKFLPESTCLSLTRKPFCIFGCSKARRDVENAGEKNMVNIANAKTKHKEVILAMIE